MLQFHLRQREQSEFFQFRGVRTEEYHGEAESWNKLVKKIARIRDRTCVLQCTIPYFHANGLEECWVPERQLHHFFDLSQLLPHTSNVIVADFIQRFFFVLSTHIPFVFNAALTFTNISSNT